MANERAGANGERESYESAGSAASCSKVLALFKQPAGELEQTQPLTV